MPINFSGSSSSILLVQLNLILSSLSRKKEEKKIEVFIYQQRGKEYSPLKF